MGKRNYSRVQKYRRRRAQVLQVGEFSGETSTSVPLALPTEQIGVHVFPSDASLSSAEDKGKEQETEPPSVQDQYGKDNETEPHSDALAQNMMEDSYCASDNVQLGIDLLNVCTETKVPLETYDKILRLFKKYCPRQPDPRKWWKTIPSRAKLMKILQSKVPTVNPSVHQVTTDARDVLTKYPFMSQLLDLFSHPQFQELESCCVNPDKESRFLKYHPMEDEGISDLACAKWYSDTYDLRIGNQPLFQDPVSKELYHNWLVPLKFYNDKTGVTAMEGSYTLEPLMFTVCVLRCHVLQSEDAWRHLGFIPSKTVKARNGEESLVFTHRSDMNL